MALSGIQVTDARELEMRRWLLELLSDDFAASGVEIDDLPDGFDLLIEGVVDSLRFAEVVADLEARLDTVIDLTEMDPLEVSRIGPLARHLTSVGSVGSGKEAVRSRNASERSPESPRDIYPDG
jgi:acyl carrier protein